jgi:hemerythrin-like domain-containing protein
MMAPIFVMLREHGEMWTTLAALAEDLADARATGAATDRCRELVGQLERHNAKEEQILYVQADSVLTAAASAGLQEFMASGRRPDGWVCTKART